MLRVATSAPLAAVASGIRGEEKVQFKHRAFSAVSADYQIGH